MANALTYQSEFTGPQMDERFAAVAQLQAALTEVETALSAKYVKPASGIPSTDLDADVNAALAKANSAIQSLADYYTKAEVDALIATINGQEYVDVSSLPTASASTMGKIYLVGPDGSGYYSYYYTSYDGSAYSWVGPLGTTQISLANYATKAELNQLDQEVNGAGGNNYTSGKVLKSGGTIIDADGWGYTDYIPYTQGNAVTWNFGGNNSGSYVLQFYDSNKAAINNGYWGATGTSGVKTISSSEINTYASSGAFIRASFRLNNTDASVTIGSTVAWEPTTTPPGLAAQLSALQTQVNTELGGLKDKTVTTDVTTLSLTQTNDKYINQNGNEASSSNFAYTEPFYLKNGEAIIIVGAGYSTQVAMLARVDGAAYTPIIVSEDNTVRTWIYTNNGEKAQFVLSYNYTKEHSCKKVVNHQVEAVSGQALGVSAEQMIFAGIPVVGIIGDSLSSGVTYDENEEGHTDYNMAWWQVLKRDSGQDYKYFARGGLTTKTWLTESAGLAKATTPGNECCAYVICLGVNDQYSYGTEYIGTSADINLSDPTQNADTFYGNYGKIIQLLTAQTPGAVFFLCTVPRTSDGYSDYNTAIRALAEIFDNAYLVDLYADYLPYFKSSFVTAHTFGGGHYSAAAYQYMGKIFEKAISDTIAANADDFKYIQFALDSGE